MQTSAGGFAASTIPPGSIPLGQWTHIAIVVSATGDATFYVDGTLVADSAVGSHTALGAGPLVIGNYSSNMG